MKSEVVIRDARLEDAEDICHIYNPHIQKTTISFEEKDVTPEEMAERVAGVQAAGYPWLVTTFHDRLVGYAFATNWRDRPAYRHTVETRIYLDETVLREGIGTNLYTILLDRLRRQNIHAVIGGITLPNAASVALHEKVGFKLVGRFSEVGRKFGRWIDVGYWQITL